MRRFATLGLCALMGLAFGTRFVAAHHSTTMFDHAKTMTIRGVVLELRWVNPHVSLLVIEAVGPGVTKVKAGDRVVVEFSPLRDTSSRGGALKKVTLVDTGQSFTANLRAQEMPGLE